MERWREEMGIEEMVLCGHSLGGMVSSAYAMAYPNRSVDAVGRLSGHVEIKNSKTEPPPHNKRDFTHQ